jgi:transposase-like protein
MPWQEVCSMEARTRFVMAVLEREDSMTELCEQYGVSRRIGYKWLARYCQEGVAGLAERPRGPRRVPWAISQAQAKAIIGLERASELGAPRHNARPVRACGLPWLFRFYRRRLGASEIGGQQVLVRCGDFGGAGIFRCHAEDVRQMTFAYS